MKKYFNFIKQYKKENPSATHEAAIKAWHKYKSSKPKSSKPKSSKPKSSKPKSKSGCPKQKRKQSPKKKSTGFWSSLKGIF